MSAVVRDRERSDAFTPHRRLRPRWVALLLFACLLGIIPAFGIGAVGVAPGQVVTILAHHLDPFEVLSPTMAWSSATDAIVWNTRAPRVLLGAIVGAVLAAAGVVLQAVVRNPLADPYILGVSSGASTGAATAIVLFGAGAVGGLGLSTMAFVGAVVAILAVVMFAGFRDVTSIRLVLAGLAVGYACSAITSLLVFASDSAEASRSVMFWLLGSVASARWDLVLIAGAVALIALVVAWATSPALDAIGAGDDTAIALGIDPVRTRILLLAVVSLAVGVMVSVSGGIGFVGLVIPHVARGLVGARHRLLLPVAAVLGGTFLVWADVVARLAFVPRELPIGVVTGIVGAPFLLMLLRKQRHRY